MNNFDNNPYNYGQMPNYYAPGYNNYSQQHNTSTKPDMRQYAFVNGIEGAKSFYLAPNQTMLLMDADNPLCYKKTSDALGKCTLSYFKLEEIDENSVRNMMQPVPQNNYASKDDIDAINKRLDDIVKRLDKNFKKDTKDTNLNG